MPSAVAAKTSNRKPKAKVDTSKARALLATAFKSDPDTTPGRLPSLETAGEGGAKPKTDIESTQTAPSTVTVTPEARATSTDEVPALAASADALPASENIDVVDDIASPPQAEAPKETPTASEAMKAALSATSNHPEPPLVAERTRLEVAFTPETNAGGRRRLAAKCKNTSYNVEEDAIRRIRRLASLESIRLDRKVESSEIVRLFLAQGLARVEGDIVFTDEATVDFS